MSKAMTGPGFDGLLNEDGTAGIKHSSSGTVIFRCANLRDQFAMAALTGLVVREKWVLDAAEKAYEYADAMMEARSGTD